MISEGSWWIRCKSDPRWEDDGTGTVGMFAVPDADKSVRRTQELLGIDIPEDLTIGYMKD